MKLLQQRQDPLTRPLQGLEQHCSSKHRGSAGVAKLKIFSLLQVLLLDDGEHNSSQAPSAHRAIGALLSPELTYVAVH